MATISTTSAQTQSRQKPKLVEIVLNDKTNDPKALDIAKKLAPEYFNLKPDPKKINTYKYYARFINYKNNKFILMTVQDSHFLCSRLGCPLIIYKEVGTNIWENVLNTKGYKVVIDYNSQNKKHPNIIILGFETVTKDSNSPIFMWNLDSYKKVN